MFKVSKLFQLLFAAAMPAYAFDPNDPADVALLDERIAAAVKPLQTHNAKLVGELRQAKKGAEIDPAAHQALETERDTLQAKVTDLEKANKALTKTAEDTVKALTGEQGFTNKLLVSNGLNEALAAAGVTNPAHLKAAAAMLRETGKIEVKAEGDVRTALAGGKPLAEFVKEWSLSDDGKAFVTAPQNGGGGGHGGSGGAGAPNPWAKDTFNLTEQGKIITTNPALAETMQKSAGAAT